MKLEIPDGAVLQDKVVDMHSLFIIFYIFTGIRLAYTWCPEYEWSGRYVRPRQLFNDSSVGE